MNESKFSYELEEKIRKADSVVDVVQICADAGIQITKEQLEAELLPQKSEELDESILDNVSGGALYYIVRRIASLWGSSGRIHGGGGHSFGGGRMGSR